MTTKKTVLSCLLGLLLPALCGARGTAALDSMKAQADEAYAGKRYEQAARLYARVAGSVESASVCYNLGCAYYRMDSMAQSVLWFERALKPDPADEDTRANLQLARGKTIDRINAKHDFVMVTLLRRAAGMLNLSQWAWACLTLFTLAMLALAAFLRGGSVPVRKGGFFASAILLLLCLLGNACALYHRHEAGRHDAAIVVSPVVTVKSTPSGSGNDLFLMHEGTRVESRENSIRDWAEIEIADGKVGWIEKKHFTVI